MGIRYRFVVPVISAEYGRNDPKRQQRLALHLSVDTGAGREHPCLNSRLDGLPPAGRAGLSTGKAPT